MYILFFPVIKTLIVVIVCSYYRNIQKFVSFEGEAHD